MKKKYTIAALILVLVIVVAIVFLVINKKKDIKEFNEVVISDIDLSNTPDGTYSGEYEFKGLYVKVSTTVKDNKISNVDILDVSGSSFKKLATSDIDGVSLSSDDVLYYALDNRGNIKTLILNGLSGDAREYVYVTSGDNVSEGWNASSTYNWISNGVDGGATY